MNASWRLTLASFNYSAGRIKSNRDSHSEEIRDDIKKDISRSLVHLLLSIS